MKNKHTGYHMVRALLNNTARAGQALGRDVQRRKKKYSDTKAKALELPQKFLCFHGVVVLLALSESHHTRVM